MNPAFFGGTSYVESHSSHPLRLGASKGLSGSFVSIRLHSWLPDRIEQNRTISEISKTGPLRQRHLQRRPCESFDFVLSAFLRNSKFAIRHSRGLFFEK